MIKKSLEKAFNEQLNAETYSAYLYWSMAAWCDKNNLPGFANWMRVQVQEEMSHAVKFYTYLIDRSGTVKLTAIAAPETDWKDIEAVFVQTLKHEQCHVAD
jgi:ferritin